MDNYNRQLESNLLEMVKQKEDADKRLLFLEILIGILASAVLFGVILLAGLVQMEVWLKFVLIGAAIVLFAAGIICALWIEQVAGYYECAKCGHKYVPSYASVFFAMHINRTRYMKCPKCGKRSWQKKVTSKE